jgi:hypothetical protein
MIYFIDEDVSQIGQWAAILRMKGLETCVIRDADSALTYLPARQDIQLVFIDVMLAASAERAERRFTRAETDDYHSTGIELLKALTAERPDVFPNRAIFLSQTGQTMIVEKIERTIKLFNDEVQFWRKGEFNGIMEFARRTEEELTIRGLL